MMTPKWKTLSGQSKQNVLTKLSFINELQLYLAVKEYLEYWNHYHLRAGLNENIVLSYSQEASSEIQEVSFLGGLLHGYS